MAAEALKVMVELPAEAARAEGVTPEDLSRELLLLWILDRVRSGRISIGKGAELAGLNRWAFLRVMNEHGVSALAYPADELPSELARLQDL